MKPDARALIRKHRRKGTFVDTNLLVLLLVGRVKPQRIRDFKRTGDFTIDDYFTLSKLISDIGPPLVTTPYILSQLSDLTTLSGRELAASREQLRLMVVASEERYDAAQSLVKSHISIDWA